MKQFGFACGALIILAAALPFAAKTRAAENASRYCTRTGDTRNGKKEIRVSGIIAEVAILRPPQAGEFSTKDDIKDTAMVLRLDDRLRVIRPGGEFYPSGTIAVKEIQVIPTEKYKYGNNLLGKHIVMTGKLSARDNANQSRAVLIEPSDIRPGGRIACDGSEQPSKS